MAQKEKLLEVRKALKDKKPDFKQQNFGRKKRVSDKWKKPRGLQSKMRHNFKGYSRTPSSGWRSPVEVRGLDNKGNVPIVISNVSQLSTLEKNAVIIISAKVGNKKRLEIITKAEELKIGVSNIKVDKFKQKIANLKSEKDKDKVAKNEKKKKSLEDSLKKAEKKEKDKKKKDESKDVTEDDSEDQKAEERKEVESVLIHKD